MSLLMKSLESSIMNLSEYDKKIAQDTLLEISSSTLRMYKKQVVHFERWAEDKNMSFPFQEMDLRDFIIHNIGRRKKSTVLVIVSAVRKLHEIANYQIPSTNITSRAWRIFEKKTIEFYEDKTPSENPAVTKEQIIVACMNLGDTYKEIRDKALILVGYYGGMRKSEIANLKINHLHDDGEGYFLTITNAKRKTKIMRKFIPRLGGEFCPSKALEDLLLIRRKSDDHVFQSTAGKNIFKGKLAPETFNQIIKKHLPGATPHSLRVAFVTESFKKTSDYKKIMNQTFHEDLATLDKYNRNRDVKKNNSAWLI